MAKLHVSESKRTHKIATNIQEKKVTTMNLENQLLIAMPSLDDSLFKKTVTYICEHNEEGAMGLIINLPIDITLCDLLKKIEPDNNDSQYESKEIDDENTIDLHHHRKKVSKTIGDTNIATDITHSLEQLVLSGGPIAKDRGFVLHKAQKGWNSSLVLGKELMITTSKDILMALGTDKAPESFMVTLGYAGWGPGQLEQELQENSWLTTSADIDILFNTPIEQRWQKATEKLGIDITHLSLDIGHA